MQIDIKNLGDFMSRFMAAMDEQRPLWPTEYATQQDLQDFARDRRPEYAMKNLRQTVANRLTMPVRACVHAGLVKTEY